ncbi:MULTISPECIES: DNA gyrase inhibitor YacG [Nitrincola]|uniref:DNA gyrase inhibitor YacG n=1 Tax=Nitrincola TaxID=267849 RepID=UPI00124F09EC|nr:DNA gyrase inhibitor YacG [Nitrincola alkalilacustris]
MTSKTIKCPQCGKPSIYDDSNKWRPFCSERCKLIDLGEWASEGYQIPVAPDINDYSSGDSVEEQPFTPTRH